APGADRDEGAVAAFLPGRQLLEPPRGGGPIGVGPAIDVTGRHLAVAGEARAGVEVAVGPDRVRVPPVDLARAHVDAVGRREPALLRLVAEERHLVVEKMAAVAGARH